MSRASGSAGGAANAITYVEDSVVGTFPAAFAVAQNITLTITRIGRVITIDVPAVSAVSGGTAGLVFAQHVGVIPVIHRPASDVRTLIPIINGDALSSTPGNLIIMTDGTVRIYVSGNQSSTFSLTGNNGWRRVSISYSVP